MKIYQIINIFPKIEAARYNLTVWQNPNQDSLYCIGREVTKPGTSGEPDTGILKLFEVGNDGKVLQEKTIWKPVFDGINLEDPRALSIPNHNLTIGLTAVLRSKTGTPIPFPAIVRINSLNYWNHELPPFLIIDTFGSGKNITPIDSHTYLFRPDTDNYNHTLIVFSLHGQIPKKLSQIEFPLNVPWADWRIGTTMPPIWLTPTEALFIIHGISKQKLDGTEKYIYSIGRAKLTRHEDRYEVTVSPDPILTPDTFLNKDGSPMVDELHPEIRRVVYSCGGVIKKNSPDRLSLFVNVGDRTTFEVEFSLEELKEGLFKN